MGDGSILMLDTNTKSSSESTMGILDRVKGFFLPNNTNNVMIPGNLICKGILHGHQDWVWSLAVLNDGRLASASEDKTICLWDLGARTAKVLRGHDGGVVSLTILANGNIAYASKDGTIRIWEPDTGKSITLAGHTGRVWALAPLKDGRFVSGSGDKTILLWDPSKANGAPRLLFVADDRITSLKRIADSDLLLVGDSSGRVHWLRFSERQNQLWQ
jgi:WD40 repeat protein